MFGFIRKIKLKRQFKQNAAYMNIDESVVMQATFHLRQDIMGEHTRLTIAKDCIIGGNFIFESSKGQVIIGEHTPISVVVLLSLVHLLQLVAMLQ